MSKTLLKVMSMLLVILLAGSIFTGCSKTPSGNEEEVTTNTTTASETSEKSKTLEPVVLRELIPSDSHIDPFIGGDPNKLPYNKIRCEELNVKIEPIFTTFKERDEKLKLLIASDETPDIVPNLANLYAGGVEKAYENGIIVKLNDYLDQYASNFKKILEQYPEFAKYAKTDDGSIFSFGQFRDKEIRCFFGPMIRKDLLEKANLTVPETVDEWYTALTAFKDMGIKFPFTTVRWFPQYSSFVSSAYGVGFNFYIGADNKMHYGPMKPGFKSFLETWSKWVSEGLVDVNYFMQNDFNAVRGMLCNGETASSIAFLSFLLQNKGGREKNPDFKLVAAKQPVLEKGQKALLGQMDPPFTVTDHISAKSENIERAIMWCDFFYSEEGHLLANFGVEGITYNMVDGYPQYTQTLLNSLSTGTPQEVSLNMYCPAAGLTHAYQDKRYFEQTRLTIDEQKDALPKWLEFVNPTALPALSMTEEEQDAYSKYADIKTYTEEMTEKFMLGNEPLTKYDKFVENLKTMGIEDVLKAQNSALERFNNR